MKIRLALLLTLIFSASSIAPSFGAGERFALVIGNAKYPDAEAPRRSRSTTRKSPLTNSSATASVSISARTRPATDAPRLRAAVRQNRRARLS
jgi:hypothetical protein